MGLFEGFRTDTWLEDTAHPQYEGDVPRKQNLYFGCNYEDIPTIIIKWSEKGRGFGEYVFQMVDEKMICHNEFDSKKTIKRVLCTMVDQCELKDEAKGKGE